MAGSRREVGQASVETVALLPLVMLVGALLWQAVVAGQALWLSGAAARAAARAAAVGADAEAAAKATLPPRLESGLRVRQVGDGVGVAVRVPSILSGGAIATLPTRGALPRRRRGEPAPPPGPAPPGGACAPPPPPPRRAGQG